MLPYREQAPSMHEQLRCPVPKNKYSWITHGDVFRDPTTKLLLGGFWLVALVVSTAMVIGAADEYPNSWLALLLVVPMTVQVILILRTKLVISDSKVSVVNTFATHVFDVNEIAAFAAERTGPYGKQVVVRLKDGSWIRVAALQCGRGKACKELEELAQNLTARIGSDRGS